MVTTSRSLALLAIEWNILSDLSEKTTTKIQRLLKSYWVIICLFILSAIFGSLNSFLFIRANILFMRLNSLGTVSLSTAPQVPLQPPMLVEDESDFSLIHLVIAIMICSALGQLIGDFKDPFIMRVCSNITTRGKRQCLEFFSKCSFADLDSADCSAEKREMAIDKATMNIAYVVQSFVWMVLGMVTSTVSLLPLFVNMFWVTISMIIATYLFYRFYLKKRQETKTAEQKEQSTQRQKLYVKMSQNNHLFHDRILHNRVDNMFNELVEPLDQVTKMDFDMSMKYTFFYVVRSEFLFVIQYMAMIYALYMGDILSAITIFQGRGSINQVMWSLISLERNLTQFESNMKPLLDLMNKMRVRKVHDQIDPREVHTIGISEIDHVIKDDKSDGKSDTKFHLHQVGSDLVIGTTKRERILLSGNSGMGKSTLLKLFAGYFDDAKAQIEMKGSSTQIVSSFGHFVSTRSFDQSQRPQMELSKTWIEFITDSYDIDTALVLKVIEWTQLTEKVQDMTKDIGGALSSGEQTRLSLAKALYRALISKSFFLFMDEPDCGLSDTMAFEILTTIFDNFDGCIIVTLHKDQCKGENGIQTQCQKCKHSFVAEWEGLKFTQKIQFERPGQFRVV